MSGFGPAAQSLTDAGVDWPSLGEIARVLTLRAGFNAAVVVGGTTLLGVGAGVVGVFMLLRKRALMSDAISHATLPGVALAFLIGAWAGLGERSLALLLLGGAATGVLGAATVQLITRVSRIREDAAIGAVLSVFFGAGVVLLSVIQRLDTGGQGGIGHFIMGQTAAMSRASAIVIGIVAVIAVVAALALFKEFRAVCFDADFARSQGWPVGAIDLLMMALVVAVTVIGLQAVGLILVVAMLIIPPAAARFWTERLSVMTGASAAIGALAGYLGASASALLPRLPAGAVIVLVAGAIFVVSMLLAPARGLVPRSARALSLRLRIAEQHALRALLEAGEAGAGGVTGGAVATGDLLARRSWSRAGLGLILRKLALTGRVALAPGGARLTARGRDAALRITRNHRLWEEYLVTHADVAPSHVDESADMVEHILSPELVATLEDSLRRSGRLPASVHPLRAGAPPGGRP